MEAGKRLYSRARPRPFFSKLWLSDRILGIDSIGHLQCAVRFA